MYAELDAYLQDQIEDLGIPGAAITVVEDGVRVHTAAFGHADDSGRPMTAQTPVLLASTSKTFTAIAVMQQVEAGRLRLDEPVQTYLPWFTLDDGRSSAITVRHLLHQTSGMASKDTAFEYSDAQDPGALADGVRDLADSPLASEPGARFRYASANFNILGLLVQEVTGQPFSDYLEQHVFDPLTMGNSHPTRAGARAGNAADGYSLWFGRWWRQTDTPAPTTGMPSSTLYSSAEDLSHQLVALLDDGRYGESQILKPESIETMFEPRARTSGSTRYAMGWFTRPLVESTDPAAPPPPERTLPRLLEHQGEWGNSHTYLAMVPSDGLGLSLVINGNDTAAPSRLKAIDSNLLRILHGQAPVPAVVQEDWLQRSSWAVALGLLLAQLLSLGLTLRFLRRSGKAAARKPQSLLAWAASALALDGFTLWLCLSYAPARFDTHLFVIIRQFPDVGISLVPVLALAILWPVPRTIWLLLTSKKRHKAAGETCQRAIKKKV
ncbi:serine hydrolase domain-containing protein [Arthrobacter sp. H20]|uniref:serine hydrolase domain-containing protein n=1 Tax=Arthrobacter sp. H20 TaxID=1267981 RepID=UPI0004B916D3|nr:serine hydrolase domain-containing protein [Arthrobacter sp. H20]